MDSHLNYRLFYNFFKWGSRQSGIPACGFPERTPKSREVQTGTAPTEIACEIAWPILKWKIPSSDQNKAEQLKKKQRKFRKFHHEIRKSSQKMLGFQISSCKNAFLSINSNLVFHFHQRAILFSVVDFYTFLQYFRCLNSLWAKFSYSDMNFWSGWIWKLGYFILTFEEAVLHFLTNVTKIRLNIS